MKAARLVKAHRLVSFGFQCKFWAEGECESDHNFSRNKAHLLRYTLCPRLMFGGVGAQLFNTENLEIELLGARSGPTGININSDLQCTSLPSQEIGDVHRIKRIESLRD